MSVNCCFIQMYFFGASVITQSCLLSTMSYDRYVAICTPLYYASIMNQRLPLYLVVSSWIAGLVLTLMTLSLLLQLEFCGSNVIDHFFCDMAPVLELSCSDTSTVQIEVSIVAIVIGLFQFVFIIITYSCIFTSIFQRSTTTERQRVFSTCSNHLSVVCIYYGSLITLYVAPSKGYSLNLNKILSLLNTALTPLFNPVIYSLRNKEIKAAMKRLILASKGFTRTEDF
ncbi:olfactory receptor 5G29-like [Pelodytes ibericus]